MAAKIFINYRRDDSIATAGRLHDRLVLAFGNKNIFMDVDRIPVGVDFVDYLNTQVSECDTFLTVIGPNWLNATDQNGRRRIDNPEDYVTVEIAAALARNIRLIPVLVDGAQMPKSNELPDAIKPLVRRHAIEVRNTQFGRDAEALIEKVREAVDGEKKSPRSWPLVTVVLSVLLLVGGIVLFQTGSSWFLRLGSSDADVAAKLRAEEEALRQAESEKLKADENKRAAAAEAKRLAEEEAKRKAPAKGVVDEAKPAAEVSPRPAEGTRPGSPSVIAGSGQGFRDLLGNGQPCPTCPEMVVVPNGNFTMGSPGAEPERSRAENPQLKVTIKQPFAVGRYAVTRVEFEAFVKAAGYQVADSCYLWTGAGVRSTRGASFRSPGITQDDRHPAVCINWVDAQAYVAWLTKITGKDYYLLSEAQREYVTRAGKTTPFWWGSSIDPTQANFDGNSVYQGGGSQGEYRQRTVAVDSFAPNPWGLYNVHGNVWEWTMDCWNESNSGNPGDGRARMTGDCASRVVRGGSWNNQAKALRSAFRGSYPARDRFNYQGFRVGRALGQ